MTDTDSHRDETQGAESGNLRSGKRRAALRRHACVYVLSLLGFVAVAEFSGVRQRLDRYLNLPTLQTSTVTLAVTSLRNNRHELPARMGLGADFRTDPNRVFSPAGVATDPSGLARLVITEVQTSNAGEVVDWEGGCPDWIELWNPGDRPFYVSGWYLTDDLDTLSKWQIPELVLSPKERILVFASGLDFCDEEELHTNFRLSKSGEVLALVRPDKTTIEQSVSVGMPSSPHGVTYGPSSDGPQPLVHPTPLKENTQPAIGFTDPVICTHNSCLFEEHFTVSLSCSTDASDIRYTTDGSRPSESNGQTYTQPLLISGTTVLRAQAMAANKIASQILTRSYLNLDQLVNQSASPEGFPAQWDETKADYEMDPRITKSHAADIRTAISQLPMVSVVANNEDVFGTEGVYANSWKRGFDWEVPAVMELLQHREEAGLQVPCGLRLAGYESRRPDWKKHSLRLSFRSRYGLSVVEHPLFDLPVVDAPNRGTGPLREPAVALEENEDLSIDATHGLQSRASSHFDNVLVGKYGDEKTKYLWTIDERGINVVPEATPFPTPRGKVVHTNLSPRASLGGEVWFESPETVSINPISGRFGAAAGMTRRQWEAAIRYWESLGYKVNAFPGQDRCSSLMLRSTDDSWASHHPAVRSRAQYMRDQWARMTEQEMGQLAARGRFVHVCINGLYWGLYNLIERPDEEYLAHQLGGKEDEYITIRSRGRRIDTDEAGELLWDRITEVASSDLSDPAQFAEMGELVDMVDLIDYCLIQMYVGNEDWALVNGNNMRVYRRRMNYAKLKFMLWDADSTFASGWKNEEVDYPLPMKKSGKKGSFVHLFRQLMKSDEFRQMFADRVDKWCGTEGVLGAAACQRRYEALLNEVEPALIAESARWGDIHSEEPYTPMEHWQTQKQRMLQDWFPNRSGILLKELKEHGLTTDSLSSESPVEPAAL